MLLRIHNKLPSVQFACPTICAHCGEQEGKHPWTIQSIFNRIFLLVFSSYEFIEFQVLICDACKARLEKSQRDWYTVLMAGSFGAIALVVLLGLLSALFISFLALFGLWAILFIGALLGGLLAAQRRSVYRTGSNIGSYNGKHFRFKNPQFHHQFSDLNPELVQRAKSL